MDSTFFSLPHYFAAAMFGKSIRSVAVSVLPAVLAMLLGALTISAFPLLANGLPRLFGYSFGA